MSLDDRIRQSIDRHAPPPAQLDTLPEGLLQRARRRIALTVALAVAIVASMVGGGAALVAGIDRDREQVPAETPSPSQTSSPADPDAPLDSQSARELVTAFLRARVDPPETGVGAYEMLSEDAGNRDYGVRLRLYPSSADLDWTGFEVEEVRKVAAGAYEADVRIAETYVGSLDVSPSTRTFRERVSVGPGRAYGDVGSARLVTGGTLTDTPSESRGDPVWFLYDFLIARASGVGASWLSPGGAADYGGGGLRLDSTEEIRLEGLVVSGLEPLGDDRYDAVLRLSEAFPGDSPVCPHTEAVRIEPPGGSDLREWLVTDAALVDRGWTVAPLDGAAARELACDFLTARVNGEGAEDFLGAGAMEQYQQGEGGLTLYPPNDQVHWGFWWVLGAEAVDGGFEVLVTLNNTGQPDAIYEELLIGPGPDYEGGPDSPALVLSARRLPCEEASDPQYCP
jgi:hypothetical protein